MVAFTAYADFQSAAAETLQFLHHRLGFDLWMVTRTEGEDWIVLQVEDHGYGVKEGTVFRWADSFCSQMVLGRGPRIAPRSNSIPAYAAAPIAKQVRIGAYVGVPLTRADGSLFGTLCAIHPAPQPEIIQEELPLVELLTQLLSTLLEFELKAEAQLRLAERAQNEALKDHLTGLYNRRGWDRLLAAEESRCRRYGHPACVVSIDLDGLKQVNDSQGHASGDALLRRAGQVILDTCREQDVAARTGGDEFAILAVECNQRGAEALLNRLRDAFTSAQVEASLGIAIRAPSKGLQQAWQAADAAMYVCKQRRKGRLHQ